MSFMLFGSFYNTLDLAIILLTEVERLFKLQYTKFEPFRLRDQQTVSIRPPNVLFPDTASSIANFTSMFLIRAGC